MLRPSSDEPSSTDAPHDGSRHLDSAYLYDGIAGVQAWFISCGLASMGRQAHEG